MFKDLFGLFATIAVALGCSSVAAAEASGCVRATFSEEGDAYWKTIALALENHCGRSVDLDGAVIDFSDSHEITDVWYEGDGQTGYPTISISSVQRHHSVQLRYPKNGSGSDGSMLLPGGKVSLRYGSPKPSYDQQSVDVQLVARAATGPEGVVKAAGGGPATQSPTGVHVPKAARGPNFRIIGYQPLNWNNSGQFANSVPPPREVWAAGYTHILISFGIFSLDASCGTSGECILLSAAGNESVQIVSGDGTESRPLDAYVRALRGLGLEVMLSIGGASSSFGTVDFRESFNQVLQSQPDFSAAVDAFARSIVTVLDRYGFTGIDIDIEAGLDAPHATGIVAAGAASPCEKESTPGFTLNQRTGSVCALTAIIESLAKRRPDLLISLAPQTLNVAPNNRVGGDALNYLALVANTRGHLDWVGVQLYNSGSMFGPRGALHSFDAAGQVSSSVAMALGLTERWEGGHGLRPLDNREALLSPDQVVLGYPVSNGSRSDGVPAASPALVNQALDCLEGGHGCAGIAPRAGSPSEVGGVFSWNVNFDRANGYAFARSFPRKAANSAK
jgi:chitinase